jgi:hypothetical protein
VGEPHRAGGRLGFWDKGLLNRLSGDSHKSDSVVALSENAEKVRQRTIGYRDEMNWGMP